MGWVKSDRKVDASRRGQKGEDQSSSSTLLFFPAPVSLSVSCTRSPRAPLTQCRDPFISATRLRPGGERDSSRAIQVSVMIGTSTQNCLRLDRGRVCFLKAVPAYPIFGRLASPQGGPDNAGAEMGVFWARWGNCQKGVGHLPEEEHQEAQTRDGNPVCFVGPERISGTMQVGWGKLDSKKGFLISLKKRDSRFDFCFSEGCLCNVVKVGSQTL